jgi:hypothetical protein
LGYDEPIVKRKKEGWLTLFLYLLLPVVGSFVLTPAFPVCIVVGVRLVGMIVVIRFRHLFSSPLITLIEEELLYYEILAFSDITAPIHL